MSCGYMCQQGYVQCKECRGETAPPSTQDELVTQVMAALDGCTSFPLEPLARALIAIIRPAVLERAAVRFDGRFAAMQGEEPLGAWIVKELRAMAKESP